LIQNKVIEDNEQVSASLVKKASITGSVAKIFGYFCGSLQALKISYYEVITVRLNSRVLTLMFFRYLREIWILAFYLPQH